MGEPTPVMLVDDNKELREVLKMRMTRRGYAVLDFASGEEAVAFAGETSEPIPYAVIDHVLQAEPAEIPRMDGVETTRQLMELDPNMCIVVFSGQAEISEAERDEARKAGARRYVYKQGGIQIEQDIDDFIRELEVLRELHLQAEGFLEGRERIAAILREIPIGTLLIDWEGFPWVANQDWRKIEEKNNTLRYPDHLLAESLINDKYRQKLIESALAGQEKDGLSLCAVHPGGLKYLHTWA